MRRVVILREVKLPDRLMSSGLAARIGQSSHKAAVVMVPGATLYPNEHRMLPDDVLATLRKGEDYRDPWPGELQTMDPA